MLKKIVLSILAATLAVGSVSGIALAATHAEEVGERGARLVYGEVIAVEGDSFRVMSFQGEECSFLVNEETRFRKGTFDDLKPGVKVAVASHVDEETAIIVAILPPDFEPGGRFAIRVRGEVTAVDAQAGKFRIQTPDGEILTFFVDEKTRYGGQLEDLSDMQVGWRAAVAAREEDEGKKIATVVIAGERPEWIKLRGTVTAVDPQAGKFRIETPDGEILTLFVNENTRYGGQLEDLSDMQVGWKAGVGAREDPDGKLIAGWVVAGERPEWIKLRGAVTAVDPQAGKFRIETPDGEITTLFVDEKTRYGGQLEDLSDLQVGWRAGVAAKEGDDGKLVAVVVIAGERPEWIKLRGTVTAVDSLAGKFRIETPDGEIVTLFVDENTRYRGQLEDLSDLQVGWKAGVGAREDPEGSLIAGWVVAGEPRQVVKARGEITAVDSGLGKFRLKKADGTVLTFFVDDATRFKGQAQGIGDLQVGWKAGVAAVEGEDGQLLARLVIAGEPRQERPLRGEDHPQNRRGLSVGPWSNPAEGQPDE